MKKRDRTDIGDGIVKYQEQNEGALLDFVVKSHVIFDCAEKL
jgi:hypothetical protein